RLAGTTGILAFLLTAHGLLDYETLELRMAEIERFVVAGLVMRRAECFRPRPSLEGSVARPHGMRSVERMVLSLGPFQQVEFDEARHRVEMGVARQPDLFEGGLR